MSSSKKQADSKKQHYFTLRIDLKNVVSIIVLVALFNLIIDRFDAVAAGINFIWDVLTPFIYGLMIAYLLNLIMVRWEKVWFPSATEGIKARSRRPMCILLSVLTVAAVIVFVIILVSGEIVNALQSLWDGLSYVLSYAGIDLDGVIATFTGNASSDEASVTFEDIQNLLGQIFDSDDVGSIITSIVQAGSEVVSGITDALIAFVFALYLLSAKERSLAALNRIGRLLLKKKVYEAVYHVCATANENLSRFFYGQCREGIVLGTLCGVGMAILQLPYAATVGFCVGLGALVPIVGAWTAGIVGALIILPVSVKQAVIFVIYLLCLQQFDGQFIYPKVVGKSVGVSSIWVLVSVFVGGGLFGIPGMFAGVPTAATIITLCREWADAQEAKGKGKGKSDGSTPTEDEAAQEAVLPEESMSDGNEAPDEEDPVANPPRPDVDAFFIDTDDADGPDPDDTGD